MIYHMRRVLFVFSVLVASVASAQTLNQAPSVDTSVIAAVLQSDSASHVVTVKGKLNSVSGFRGTVYPLLNIIDSTGVVQDQIVSQDTIDLNSDEQILYQVDSVFARLPQEDDTIVLVMRDASGVPLDIKRLDIDWTGVTLDISGRQDSIDITDCAYDTQQENISCSYSGIVPDHVYVSLYQGTALSGSLIQKGTVATNVVSENSMEIPLPSVPSDDGLYVYVIHYPDGVYIHQGSVRVGPIQFPELATEVIHTDSALFDNAFVAQMVVLASSFVILLILSYVILMGTARRKWLWVAILSVMLAGIIGGYYVYAEVYQSTDYGQYRYTVKLDPVADNTYWFMFAALDTYTANPPLFQHVQITFNGTDYVDLIDSSTGEMAYVREIMITPEQAATTAVRIVDGCAGYYSFSSMGVGMYGYHDCEPIPLIPSVDSIVGCMNPDATNYNPSAVIDSGSCRFVGCIDPAATNYNPRAVIDDGTCDYPTCYWTPMVPDPVDFCENQSFIQTETCTGETRTITGSQTRSWQPSVSASDICIGSSVTQTEQCSASNPAATRVIAGTSEDTFCITPDTEFEVSTNLSNWSSCADARLQLGRSNQVIYAKPTGTEPGSSWSVSQTAGQITGTVSPHQDDVVAIAFNYVVPLKKYEGVKITMTSPAGNTVTQTCSISILDMHYLEN